MAILNILWFILGGFIIALGYVLGAIVLCITIIGIPFGIQSFKFIPLALSPFGKEVVRSKDLRDERAAAQQAG